MFIVALALLIVSAACDKEENIDPTVFRGQVVWADDETPVPNARIGYTGSRPGPGIVQNSIIVLQDTISVDEFGQFDFSVPGEVDSESVSEIVMSVDVGPGNRIDTTYYWFDLLFPEHINERLGNIDNHFVARQTYELTIGLPR